MSLRMLASAGSCSRRERRPRSTQPRPMPTLPLTQLDERALAADLDNRTFSLTFAQPVPIRELLLLLVRGTNLSIVPDPRFGGTFIGELKNVTVRQALDLILPPLGLAVLRRRHRHPGVRARAGNADLRRQLRRDRAHVHRHRRWRRWRTQLAIGLELDEGRRLRGPWQRDPDAAVRARHVQSSIARRACCR